MDEIFHVKDLDACTQDRGCLTYTCDAKVSFVNGADQSIIGYAMDEDDKHLFALLESGSRTSVQCPMQMDGCYVYDCVKSRDGYKISHYWPI
eukprot:14063627-Ditylum_brightwellii.AAC.1